MNDKYEINTIDLNTVSNQLQSSLDSINTISIGALGSNGTSATDFTWNGNSGLTGGTGTVTWNTTPNVWTTISATGTNAHTNQAGKLTLQGENADVDINGKSMKAWMEKVEERLNILTPNPELEKEWDELRRLGERYRKLEKKCKEKAKMWEELKKIKPTGI